MEGYQRKWKASDFLLKVELREATIACPGDFRGHGGRRRRSPASNGQACLINSHIKNRTSFESSSTVRVLKYGGLGLGQRLGLKFPVMIFDP